jgi:NADH:ubiquinone oxidoreductase subunit E
VEQEEENEKDKTMKLVEDATPPQKVLPIIHEVQEKETTKVPDKAHSQTVLLAGVE